MSISIVQSGKIQIKLLELRSNPKHCFTTHEGETRDYNIPQIITNDYITETKTELLKTMFLFINKVLQSLKCRGKINDGLATIHDIMIKPVHDLINH